MARPGRGAWTLWAAFGVAVVLARLSHVPPEGGVFQIYRTAAEHWLQGAPLYRGAGGGFLYPPTAAVAMVPFVALPFPVGAALWRLLNVAVFALGVRALARTGGETGERFLAASLAAVAMSWSAARHGQMTLLVAGLAMAALPALERGRWWRAALLLASALVLKPMVVFFAAGAAVLYPAVRARLAVTTLLLLAAPFATQDPAYVRACYVELVDVLRAVAGRGTDAHVLAHFFSMLDVFGLSVDGAETKVRASVGLAVLALGAGVARARPGPERRELLYGLGAAYTLLFSPATEPNTYALIGPSVGLALFEARRAGSRSASTAVALALLVCLASRPLAQALSRDLLFVLKPLGCCVLLGVLALRCRALGRWTARGGVQTRPSSSGEPASALGAASSDA